MLSRILSLLALTLTLNAATAQQLYTPSDDIRRAQAEFAGNRFGIFIHWGIYSMFAQGEWYLNYGPDAKEYAKAARGFYPADFDAEKWVDIIKESGARYVTFTSRHHDSFSMWHTDASPYNIVDATPFKRDVIKELADACHKKGLNLHLYYSHLDWTREDYPMGRTGKTTGRDSTKADWNSYFKFMNTQLTELLTRYGKINAIWFDGWWDHDSDSVPFDWHLSEQYNLIHSLQPGCLIGNNHHQVPFAGEDIQIFERDVPGENSAGLSGQDISKLPLETCQTMNGMWGYKIKDQDYKSTRELIHLLVKTASKGANLLLNVGPQPNGEIPATAVERLKEMGQWLKKYGTTIYGTTAGDFQAQPWGASTRRGDTLFIHILDNSLNEITLPIKGKVAEAHRFDNGTAVKTAKTKSGEIILTDLPERDVHDLIIELHLKK